MKASELRIGNYVLSDGGIVEVDELGGCDKITTTANFEGSCNGKIEPIRLTEEWLLKFGFADNKYNGLELFLSNEEKYYSIRYMFNSFPLVLDTDGNRFPLRNIQHVHQLQNLYFALTGSELTC